MSTYKSSPGALMDCLRPFFLDPNFHDLKILCGNGETVLTTKLLFSAFLQKSVQLEMCQIDQVLQTLFSGALNTRLVRYSNG